MVTIKKIVELVALTQLASGSVKFERASDFYYFGSGAVYNDEQCEDHLHLRAALIERVGKHRTRECLRESATLTLVSVYLHGKQKREPELSAARAKPVTVCAAILHRKEVSP